MKKINKLFMEVLELREEKQMLEEKLKAVESKLKNEMLKTNELKFTIEGHTCTYVAFDKESYDSGILSVLNKKAPQCIKQVPDKDRIDESLEKGELKEKDVSKYRNITPVTMLRISVSKSKNTNN